MNIAINIICVYLAREKVIKINLFCGDKANRRVDPAAEYRRRQGTSGLEDLRPETESGVGDLHQLVEIRAFPRANRHPLQDTVEKLRQRRDVAARGEFALRLPLLQKLSERLLLHRMAGFDGIGDIRRGGGQRGGGIDNKAAGRRLFAGKAGGDRREVVAQRLIDGFPFGQQHGFVLRGTNSAYRVGAFAPVASTRSASEVAS